jgi:hypothetical protein
MHRETRASTQAANQKPSNRLLHLLEDPASNNEEDVMMMEENQSSKKVLAKYRGREQLPIHQLNMRKRSRSQTASANVHASAALWHVMDSAFDTGYDRFGLDSAHLWQHTEKAVHC